jgi:superfamily II DNA or RNA helicase
VSKQLLTLRDYQSATIERLMTAWASGRRRLAAVLPTGAGKTVIFAHLIERAHAAGARSLVLAHRDELIEQAADKLHQVAPHLRVGIIKGARREMTGTDVCVASVQSLAREERRREVIERLAPRLLVIDEAHHAVARTYMDVIVDLGGFDPDIRRGALVAGFTATLARADRVALGTVWEDVAHRVDILDLIRRGFLLRVRGVRVKIAGLDMSKVKRTAGDFSESALGEAMHDALAPAAIVRAYVEHAKGRQAVAFLPTVALAYELAEAFREEGITALAVDGTTPIRERRAAIEASKRGEVMVLCNAMLFVEGTDLPWIDVGILARPTSSGPLYVQMVGRVLRPYPGQREALVLDVVGVGGRHKLGSLVDLTGADRIEDVPEDLLKYEDEEGVLLGEDDGYGSTPRPEGADGELASELFDLFGASHQVWLRTARGVWFIDVGESLVFLAPGSDIGRYNVGRCPKRAAGGEWLHEDLDLSYAMSWGEQVADGTHTAYGKTKTASWRKGMPSQRQCAAAARWGVRITPGMTQGAVSDALAVCEASSRLDPAPAVRQVTERGYW